MEDLQGVGGIPAVLKYLLKKGFIHGDCMTVTGKTLGENLEPLPELPSDQKIIFPVENPIKKDGHIRILKGNLGISAT